MKILIVDDHEENRYLLQMLLQAAGHAVRQASNGAEALEILQAGGIDLIVSDILMPVMDGFQLCRKVRTDERLRHIPFIIYTATYTGPKDEEFALKIGADRYLLKPCEPKEFMAAVEAVLAAGGRRDDAAASEPMPEQEALKLYSERLVRKLEQKMEEAEREIAARIEAEKALRASEEKYRSILDNIEAGYFEVDLAGNFTFYNDAMCNILGYSHAELMGKNNREYMDAENAKKVFQTFHRVFTTGAPAKGFDWELIKKDGSRCWMDTSVFLVKDDRGNPVGFRGIAQDITERKEAEDALRASEAKYRRLAENISDVIWQADLDLKTTYVSRSVERLLGEPVAVHLARPIEERLTPASLEKVTRILFEEFEKEEDPRCDKNRSRIVDVEHYRADGSTVWLSINLSFIRDEQGTAVGIQGVTRDITALKQAEAERETLQARLVQAQKMESVGRLAGGVAHDFNNMLGVIVGYAELARQKVEPSDPLHEDLGEILAAAQRATDVTRQLLAFARKQMVAPRVLDLNDAMEGMLKMLRRLIGEDIDLQWLPETGLWPIRIDPSQLDQLLANLCVNARDAIAGVGKVTIETHMVTFDTAYCADHAGFVPGEFVLLAVSDDGCGMDRETLANLFEPFFTTKGVGEGTGLGLATVYGIVKQNEGFINVYSEPGEGTTFKIYLPRHRGETVVEPLPQEVRSPQGRGETVLLVEDEMAVLKLGQRMLEVLGYRVLAAAGAAAALELAESHEGAIHLLITDVVMPEMNGRDLAERLKALYPGLKVLFMSGYTANVIAHRGVLEEGVDFIQKPFSRAELAAKVRGALGEGG